MWLKIDELQITVHMTWPPQMKPRIVITQWTPLVALMMSEGVVLMKLQCRCSRTYCKKCSHPYQWKLK
jgi:hypothetical protein